MLLLEAADLSFAAGNLCFFNSLLQALSYTPKLPRALYPGYPTVPEPPPPEQDEPLSRFQPGQKKAATAEKPGSLSKAGSLKSNADDAEAADQQVAPAQSVASAGVAQATQPEPSDAPENAASNKVNTCLSQPCLESRASQHEHYFEIG